MHGIHPRTVSNPVKNKIATPINEVLESRVLGRGKADGVVITSEAQEGRCVRTEWQLLQFDDSNNAFPSNNDDGCVKKKRGNTTSKINPRVLMVATGDGCGKGNKALGGS